MAGTNAQHLLRGDSAEELAENFLVTEGFTVVDRNYRCKQGEIDLIVRQGETLHFVEVKGRWSRRRGTPLEQVTKHKMYRLARAAQHYLRNHSALSGLRLYFSVIGIDATHETPRLSWVPDAFEIPS